MFPWLSLTHFLLSSWSLNSFMSSLNSFRSLGQFDRPFKFCVQEIIQGIITVDTTVGLVRLVGDELLWQFIKFFCLLICWFLFYFLTLNFLILLEIHYFLIQYILIIISHLPISPDLPSHQDLFPFYLSQKITGF